MIHKPAAQAARPLAPHSRCPPCRQCASNTPSSTAIDEKNLHGLTQTYARNLTIVLDDGTSTARSRAGGSHEPPRTWTGDQSRWSRSDTDRAESRDRGCGGRLAAIRSPTPTSESPKMARVSAWAASVGLISVRSEGRLCSAPWRWSDTTTGAAPFKPRTRDSKIARTPRRLREASHQRNASANLDKARAIDPTGEDAGDVRALRVSSRGESDKARSSAADMNRSAWRRSARRRVPGYGVMMIDIRNAEVERLEPSVSSAELFACHFMPMSCF